MNAIILSAIWAVIMMLGSFMVKRKGNFRHIAAFGLLVLFVANIADTYGYSLFNFNNHGFLQFTRFGYLFNSIAIFSSLIYVLITGKEISRYGNHTAEYFALIFFVMCGVSMLAFYNNLLTLFLGIEIMTIPLYILTGSDKRNMKSNEAALKYFLMGSFSTGIMLMGIVFSYGGTGTFSLDVSRAGIPNLYNHVASFLEIVGLLLLLVSLAFKVSAAPFHFWTPDVYDGAPSVFTSFMATIVKAAGFIAFIKLCKLIFGKINNGGVDFVVNYAVQKFSVCHNKSFLF